MTDNENTFYRGGLRTMVRAHLWYGIAGVAIGLMVSLVLVTMGPEWLRASPLFSVIALSLVFGIGTSMAGGLLHLTSGAAPAPVMDDGTASREA